MKTYHAESARAGLQAAARAGLPWQEFGVVVTELLKRAIPFDGMCIGIVDPATKLVASAIKVDLAAVDEKHFLELEYGAPPDFDKYAELSRRPMAVGSLVQATEGDLSRSKRYREILVEHQVGDEVRGAVREGAGMWGHYTMYRQLGQTGFSPAELDFLGQVERTIALGLRRGLIAAGADQAKWPGSAADVVILDDANVVTAATPGAEARVAELGGDLWARLPVAMRGVAATARAVTAGLSSGVPEVRVRSATGEWLRLHAAPVRGRNGVTSQVAVTIESAGAAKIIPLLVGAYGLTDRERDVVQHVLRGDSTAQIAAALHLSPYTVQDHLKMIFDKCGVTSRRELTSQIFFTQYWTRFGADVDANGWFVDR